MATGARFTAPAASSNSGEKFNLTERARPNRTILKGLMTITVILAAWLRLPEVLTEPRFWAEEGTNYFAYAFNHGWVENLLTPQFGYNTLYNSMATSLAASVPLEYAAAVTTYLAFTAQLSVSTAAIWWDIPLLDSLPKKFVIALLIQTLAYPQIWATTIGVQYWLCVLTVLILLYNHRASSRRMFILQNCLLVLNGLTGILSCILVPVFALKSVTSRSLKVLVQTLVLSCCLLIQVAIFLRFYLSDDAGLAGRFAGFHPLYVLSKTIRFLITVPFYERYMFSSPSGEALEISLRKGLSIVTGPAIFSPQYNFYLFEMLLGLAVIGFLLILTGKRIRQPDIQLLTIAIVLQTIISTCFSLNSSSGPRYTFAPSIMLMLLIVSAVNDRAIPKLLRYGAVFLVVLPVFTSLAHYRGNMLGGVAYDGSWPRWQAEVKEWRTNHRHTLRIWPPGWTMTLSSKEPSAAGLPR